MKRKRILAEGQPVRVTWDTDEEYILVRLGPEQSEVRRVSDKRTFYYPNRDLEPE